MQDMKEGTRWNEDRDKMGMRTGTRWGWCGRTKLVPWNKGAGSDCKGPAVGGVCGRTDVGSGHWWALQAGLHCHLNANCLLILAPNHTPVA